MSEAVGSADRLVADRYRLRERLGSGGMGTVWRGEDTLLGRDVAVKEIAYPSGVSESERQVLRERIRREARASAQLDHPGAITVHDVVEEGASTYLVMQYVPARTLSQIVGRDGPLSPQQTARVGLAVLSALRAAHARGIVHRDVKPSNVLVTEPTDDSDARVFLTDFGIASSPGDARLTSTGLLLGSPGYISPERARGDGSGPPSDLWSLGATLFTAVEGHPPYGGSDAMSTLIAVMVGEHAPYVAAGPLEPVLARLLARDPAERMTAVEAETALAQVAASPDRPALTVPLPVPLSLDTVEPAAAARTTALHVGDRRQAGAPSGAVQQEPPVRPRTAGLPRPALRTGRRKRRKVALLGVITAVAVASGAGYVLFGAGDQSPGGTAAGTTQRVTSTARPSTPAASPPARPALPALPPGASTDQQLLTTISDLAALTRSGPGAAGPKAESVLAGMRQVQALDSAPRQSRAIAVNSSVGSALATGDLDPAVGQRVQDVLDGVARPARLVDLVQLVDAGPTAVGQGGPALVQPLFALDHEVPATRTAGAAAALVTSVTDAGRRGELSEAFTRAALPLLQGLSDPAPYRALNTLLVAAERDPGAIGPAGVQVRASLRKISAQPVFDQAGSARDLLALVQQDGRVTPAFRSDAVAALTPLVR